MSWRISMLLFTLLFSLRGFAIKIAHGPYLQNVYQDEATIVWVADKPSIGWIELAPDDDTNFYATNRTKYYDTKIGIRQTSLVHAVRLTGLKPGTTYRYRVYAQEVIEHHAYSGQLGHVAATDVFNAAPLHFTTCNPDQKETSFVMLNDIHERANIIEPLLSLADYKKKDMVIFNGDMLNFFPADTTLYKGFLDEAVRLFAREKPFYYVRGNHETRGEWAERFQQFVCPRQPHLYFSWRQGPIFFIALDTGEDKPDDDVEYSGFNSYDAYRTEQARWLKQVVSSEEYRKARFHVVIGHVPPAVGPSAWHGDIEVKNKFVPILNKAGIDVMLCGHLHEFRYTPASADIHFPVIVNSNNSCLFGSTQGNELRLKIVDLKGKTIFEKLYEGK